MTRLARTSVVAVLALIAGLLGAMPAQAVPAGAVQVFTPGPSSTPTRLTPMAQTAAGLAYADNEVDGVWVRPAGGPAEIDTRFGWPHVMGDLIARYDWSNGNVVWRTIADDTMRTAALPVGDTWLAMTARGYLAQRGAGPYQLVHADLLGNTSSVVGTAGAPFSGAQAGPLGAVARIESAGDDFRYFAFGSAGSGVSIPTPAGAGNCEVTRTHLYCTVYTGQSELHRMPLTGAAATSVLFHVVDLAETSTGIVFTTPVDITSPEESYRLMNWPTASAAPVERLPASWRVMGSAAPSNIAGTVVVERSGPVTGTGQAGLYSVGVPSGTPVLLQAAAPQGRAATHVAIGPGSVAWSDNNSFDGSIWTRDLGTGGLTGSAARLVTSNATGATLSVSADRFTYTQGTTRFGGTRLLDGTTVTPIDDRSGLATLSGDRLLSQTTVYTADASDEIWRLRNLRTGASAVLADARSYDVWGERLVRLDADGSVWLHDLRTNAAPVALRAATPAPYLYGGVHIAGDTVVWDIHRRDGAMAPMTEEQMSRNVATMAPAAPVTGLRSVLDLSTGYVFGQACGETTCDSTAVPLAGGSAIVFDGVNADEAAVDGNLAAFVGVDRIPAVVALPAYPDAPRLLTAPGATPASLTAGQSWSVRVVASRVLSVCAVEIRNASNAVVRSLPCTDANAATTVTWDGRDTAGALVPAGTYGWRIVGATGASSLVDYDGSTSALSGSVTVSGVTGPTVTATSPVTGGISFAPTGNVTATFSKAVQGVSATTFRLRTAAGAAVTAPVTYDATTRVATLNPGVTLAADTRYTATLTGGTTAIRDGANVPLPTTTWSFTTGPAPTATTLSPAPNGTSFAITGNPSAIFSEAVTGVSGTTVTLATAAGTPVAGVVTYNATTRQATLNPSAALAADTRYTATLSGGTTAIRDAAGNPLATRTWSFTTGPAPTVTTRTPATNATGVVNTSNVTAVFSEAVQGVSGTTVRLRNPAGTIISAVVSYNATTRTVTLNPSANLAAATRYTVGLAGSATAIRDLAGNPLTTVTWAFTTR